MGTNYSFWQYVGSAALWTLLIVVYFVPALVARARRHRSVGSVVVIDLLLGWTVIGWIVALALALSGNVKA